jgi:hypothetical protein
MSGAVLSADGRYRYMLTRELEATVKQPSLIPRSLTWVMLNPSTADASEDDATIRRVRWFSRAWGATRFAVVNLFAFRSTHPNGIPLDDVLARGPEWLYWTMSAVEQCDGLVFAWGAHPRAAAAARVFEDGSLLRPVLRPLCLGLTLHGAPRHPLRVPCAQQLVRYSSPATSSRLSA